MSTFVGPANPIDHPPQYTKHPSGVECIQITEHMGFNLGNAVKYIWRADLKGNAVEDLMKARWYINRELDKLREKEIPIKVDWAEPQYDAQDVSEAALRQREDHQKERGFDVVTDRSGEKLSAILDADNEFEPCSDCHSHVCIVAGTCSHAWQRHRG